MLIKLGLIEDDMKLRENYTDFFNREDTFKIIFSLTDIKDLHKDHKKQAPDIILLDLMLPSGNSLDRLHQIKQLSPYASIIILTSVSDPKISRFALEKGAKGFLLKSSSLQFIKDALQKAFEGGIPLSPSIVNHFLEVSEIRSTLAESYPALSQRELELIYLLKTGMSNKMAASILNVTFFTVNYHTKNIYKKLRIHSKSELIAITTKFKYVQL